MILGTSTLIPEQLAKTPSLFGEVLQQSSYFDGFEVSSHGPTLKARAQEFLNMVKMQTARADPQLAEDDALRIMMSLVKVIRGNETKLQRLLGGICLLVSIFSHFENVVLSDPNCME